MAQSNQAVYRAHKGSKQVIIFIHGILEGPKQFEKMAQIAYEQGFSTYCLLLPGHGRESKVLAKTSYKQWLEYVSWETESLLEQYNRVIFVGHSMGTLLAICEASVRKEKVKALFLINPPMKVHLWPRVIKSGIDIQRGKIKRDERYTVAEYHALNIGRLSLTSWVGILRRYSEFFSIKYYTKKQIPKLKLPIFLVFADKDEFVNLKSQIYFRQCKGCRFQIQLKDSGHFCYHHSDLIELRRFYEIFLKYVQKQP